MRQMDLGVAAQAGAVEPRAGGRMDDRRDDLAKADVGQAEDGRLGHAGMALQTVFHFLGGDILAAAHNDVLGPVDDE